VLVTLTAEHIRAGKKSNGEKCPVFLAMKDAGLPVTHVGRLFWSDRPASEGCFTDHLELPESAQLFIGAFDYPDAYRTPARPFEFEIDYQKEAT
jgi:hypothetical protein